MPQLPIKDDSGTKRCSAGCPQVAPQAMAASSSHAKKSRQFLRGNQYKLHEGAHSALGQFLLSCSEPPEPNAVLSPNSKPGSHLPAPFHGPNCSSSPTGANKSFIIIEWPGTLSKSVLYPSSTGISTTTREVPLSAEDPTNSDLITSCHMTDTLSVDLCINVISLSLSGAFHTGFLHAMHPKPFNQQRGVFFGWCVWCKLGMQIQKHFILGILPSFHLLHLSSEPSCISQL